MEKLQPWMRGPFELIRHAHGHLRDGGDTDRRIALIGFDNAIEVCIDVFIRLHPKLRGGVDLAGQDVEGATRNYHTRIEFLDKYLEARALQLIVPIKSILWYHQLRNELYHSGNGMVPEAHVVEGAAGAAIAVCQSLFGVEIASQLGASSAASQRDTAIPYIPKMTRWSFFVLSSNSSEPYKRR